METKLVQLKVNLLAIKVKKIKLKEKTNKNFEVLILIHKLRG